MSNPNIYTDTVEATSPNAARFAVEAMSRRAVRVFTKQMGGCVPPGHYRITIEKIDPPKPTT